MFGLWIGGCGCSSEEAGAKNSSVVERILGESREEIRSGLEGQWRVQLVGSLGEDWSMLRESIGERQWSRLAYAG